jgi:hypothetical protein
MGVWIFRATGALCFQKFDPDFREWVTLWYSGKYGVREMTINRSVELKREKIFAPLRTSVPGWD